ncbi:LysR family transcriptional regulator [Halomonas halocynthiae]|uniref:LysR family transcriptional regulator n=1 Tax=Halomonas halocynthiae TaxID=176290 RepID=UPI000403073C|nr:LysR family transcriptional regulator [Halomonas halocynthiae]
MELRHLHYFRVVAEELNFTRAAERLYISQPPLSRQIKKLEEEIGAVLFERSTRGVALTASGQFLYEHTLQILEKVESTVAATRRIARSKRDLFSIGFVPSAFYGQLPLLVRSLRQKDNVELVLTELTTIQQVQALKAGRIDIGFGRLRIDDPEVEQEVLYEEPMMAALPSDHALEGKRPTLAELAKEPIIVFPTTPRPSLADIVLGLFHRRGLKVEVAQETNELQTALGLVVAGLGFTLVPEKVSRLKRHGISYAYLADSSITSPVLCSRRKNETPSTLMLETNETLRTLMKSGKKNQMPSEKSNIREV